MQMQRINPEGVAATASAYSQMVTVSDATLLFLAGQVAWDLDRNVVGKGDLRAQAIQAFENVRVILASVGADFSSVVKVTYFVVNFNPSHRQAIVEARGMHFVSDGNMPASTLIGVQALAEPDLLIEIEVIAAIERR